MRHNRDEKRFKRRVGHLRCMMANMTSDLILRESIKTTTPKAKELRKVAERMITLGKAGDTAARRRAMAFMRNKNAVTKLFDDVALRFKSRNGGYTRIMKLGFRPGDCAPVSIIELVEKQSMLPAVTEGAAAEKKAKAPKAPKAPKEPKAPKAPKPVKPKKEATAKPKAEKRAAAPKKGAKKKGA
ncbi:MAG: 50S ribosomal protein L17 [Deltaproteobacteria bacterium]|nr:50S ribosomal protein L17 [Deltaproteobacteria bacterium]